MALDKMDEKHESHFHWVNSSMIDDVDQDFATTFRTSEKQSDLQIWRFSLRDTTSQDEKLDISGSSESVLNQADIVYYSESRDRCQIFCVGQKNSYARLNITKELFKRLLYSYRVFDRIWDFILPFSFKTRESDIGHAPFRFRQSEPVLLNPGMKLGSFECAYGFRYVAQNNRREMKEQNPDYSSWSVRQTAVYQQYDSVLDRIMLVLIAPSKMVLARLQATVQHSVDDGTHLNAFNLHRIIISTLHENWRLYIRSQERLLMDQSDRVTLAQVRSDSEHLSPLNDLPLNFVDRQRLKKIEDEVLDLIIVFDSLHSTLSKLKRQCELHCMHGRCQDCVCSAVIEEIEEQMHEVQVNLNKVKVLRRKAQGTSQLLSDLLDYENAQIAHINEKSLNGLVKESKDENNKMRLLTERSARDAAAVKILTVITLIYLPTTVVMNFFSTQLVHVNGDGQISLISQSWWFVVAATPLTIATFVVWKIWLSCVMRAQKRKELPQYNKVRRSRRLSVVLHIAPIWNRISFPLLYPWYHWISKNTGTGPESLPAADLEAATSVTGEVRKAE